jgi:23S rRNA pseudouridine1911/1915/1917 synthase
MLDLSVPAPSHGERLDRFLAAAQADLSRSRLQQLIRGGRVSVNGRAARASHRLRDGDRIRIELPESRPARLVPEELPLTIVHEDDDLIVIDKPAGTVVHPGAGVMSGTLVHALLHRYPEIADVGGEGRPGIVHRLDKDTSGLIAVARSARAYRALVEALRARTVHRRYRALVWGDPRSEGGTISAAVGRDPHERKRMAVVARGGREARTHWRVTERFGLASHLELELDTGRTHQIRVHLTHLRHPVVGDPVYGGRGKKLLSLPPLQRSLGRALLECLPRQALHASQLELLHPVTGTGLTFRATLPDDFARALKLLRDAMAGGE